MDHRMEILVGVEETWRDHNSSTKELRKSEHPYMNEDKIQTPEAKRTGSAPSVPDLMQTGAGEKSSGRAAAVCLGLLCILLLIGLITLVFLYIKGNSERDQLQTSYNNLTKERDQLQTSYNNLNEERNQLQTSYIDLNKERDQLQTSYNYLNTKHEQLQTSYNDLIQERDQLQTSYNNLIQEQDQLQASYNNLIQERDQLRTSYNNLIQERDQLRTSYNNLIQERDLLRKRFDDLVREKNDLQRTFQELGWVYFSGSFYYISSLEKSWQQSREDCWRRGADLAIINSKSEQEYIRRFQRRFWFGLTDSGIEGIWKWVDGTPLTASYWAPNEPNSYRGTDEDCAETLFYTWENSWNDEPCHRARSWICEKRSA
ncbi:CD209 antigen-like [Larimichthys crocea]|uniref:CD209 antigen-like n=1 Tax=Larimichthys crocea TaxID=215358 RepID=UPI000F5D820E|nr:CD209 antigen-like [Larimichthys crocea]